MSDDGRIRHAVAFCLVSAYAMPLRDVSLLYSYPFAFLSELHKCISRTNGLALGEHERYILHERHMVKGPSLLIAN